MPEILTPSESNAIRSYVAEEVDRQGRGPDRIPGMFKAWMDAIENQFLANNLNAQMVQRWAAMIEPEYNEPGAWRSHDVVIRDGLSIVRKCPRASVVSSRMARYFELFPDMTAMEAYLEFEFIHPFGDGNGRTGKIILNWQNGTLLAPIFPPNDIFGYPIRNP